MADIKQVVTVPQIKTLLAAIKPKFAMSVNGNKPDADGKVTMPAFGGASESAGGTSGVVPAPSAGDESKFLCASGVWQEQKEVDATRLAIVGTVLAYAGNAVPDGYLQCNGAAVSRTIYAALYAAIGTTYGSGNGSTTFNLPNLTDRFIEGSNTAGTAIEAGLPNITGTFKANTQWNLLEASGAFTGTDLGKVEGPSGACWGTDQGSQYTFKASASSDIYGNSDTVQPPSVTMRYIIKY